MSRPFYAPHNVATVLAQLYCYQGKLAQDAPTSPILSNMIAFKLDAQLQRLAAKELYHYTRYADDITFSFSCQKQNLPRSIVATTESGVVIPGDLLTSIIEKNGFAINSEKTRLKSKTQRQMVTGVIVNKFPNLQREYIRRTGSMINALKKYGPEAAEKKYLEILKGHSSPIAARQESRIAREPGDFFIKVVKGRLNYIQMIKGRDNQIYRKLAYKFTVAIGKENKDYLRTAEELLSKSIFVLENGLDISQGTAFLLKGVGIVTNSHVIAKIGFNNCLSKLTFTTAENVPRTLTASLIYNSPEDDIAIFYPGEDFLTLTELETSKSDRIKPLDPILVIGFPNHAAGATPYISRGTVVQNRNLHNRQYWVVSNTLLSGNSGGPIFNSSMEVIGIATMGTEENDQSNIKHCFLPIKKALDTINTKEYKFHRKMVESRNAIAKGTSLPTHFNNSFNIAKIGPRNSPAPNYFILRKIIKLYM
jgi:RNA-directed DNA polymerase